MENKKEGKKMKKKIKKSPIMSGLIMILYGYFD